MTEESQNIPKKARVFSRQIALGIIRYLVTQEGATLKDLKNIIKKAKKNLKVKWRDLELDFREEQ